MAGPQGLHAECWVSPQGQHHRRSRRSLQGSRHGRVLEALRGMIRVMEYVSSYDVEGWMMPIFLCLRVVDGLIFQSVILLFGGGCAVWECRLRNMIVWYCMPSVKTHVSFGLISARAPFLTWFFWRFPPHRAGCCRCFHAWLPFQYISPSYFRHVGVVAAHVVGGSGEETRKYDRTPP